MKHLISPFAIIRRLMYICFFTLLLLGCRKDDDKLPVVDFDFEDMIDRYVLNNKSTYPDGDVLTFRWESSDDDISFFNEGTNTSFLLPDRNGNTTTGITLSATDGSHTVSTTKTLPVTELTWYRVYSMGTSIQSFVDNDVQYEWFIDQNTSMSDSTNCGPACATMALKWVYPDFDKTTDDARNIYYMDGKGWYTSTIVDYLNLYEVGGKIIPFGIDKSNDLVAELNNGNIAILCLDMYYIRKYTKGVHFPVDKFYYTDKVDWGHFIVVKGYKAVNEHVLFEVYDPASSMRYSNGTYMGQNRLYRAEDIMKATDIWWKYAIVVYPQSRVLKGIGKRSASPFNMGNIPNQKGGAGRM
jgi:hypothetical protein